MYQSNFGLTIIQTYVARKIVESLGSIPTVVILSQVSYDWDRVLRFRSTFSLFRTVSTNRTDQMT
jgi:hypothetical protein